MSSLAQQIGGIFVPPPPHTKALLLVRCAKRDEVEDAFEV